MWPLAAGAKVGKYRLERLLGSGGMGSVYLARDLDLERDVAIKFIAADRSGDSAAQRRLIHEARAAAALDHPNICAVHDVLVEADGRACIVMQYVEGETLSARLERGALEPRQAFLIAADMASALAAAHRRGIVHRDIKPHNIIITPSGKAKLLDFGIARLEALVAGTDNRTTSTGLTGPGRIAGTPMYMSPEQVQQLPLDGRSDLFSLGAVLFECLTGRRPFDARTDAEIYVQILHDHPPPVSTLRPQLTEREDELCRRLLAKHPDDRFASADELLGALRVLAPDTAHPSGTGVSARTEMATRPSRSRYAAAFAIVIAVATGIWQWQRPKALPDAPPEAERWYVRGTEAIRDGSYHSARLALQEAIDAFPQYALAYARIAEAYNELDESDAAQKALLNVDNLVDDRSRLPVEDRLRLDAVRSAIIGDVPAAIRAYTELADRRPSDAGVWLDLGRAQETAALPGDARASYERAIAADRHYAPAHLRRAVVLSQQGRRDEALQEFDEAERLYRAAANIEGETETALRRGTFLTAVGRLTDARVALERAQALAASLKSTPQQIRAQLRLGNVTAAEGRLAEAEQLADSAIDSALAAGLETVAADGMIELAITLIRKAQYGPADAHLTRAVQLAEKRGAQRLLARAQLQRAYVLIPLGKPAEALALAESAVRFMRSHGYRRHELVGLSIMSRAHEGLRQYAQARPIAEQALRIAEEIKDDAQAAEALENLAGQSTALGALPDALRYRERTEQIHRSQKNVSLLVYDLTSRAELLLRLGRFDEAARVLEELDAGIAAGIDAYKQRARRLAVLRALDAAFTLRFDDAARHASSVLASSPSPLDSTGQFAATLQAYADARAGRRRSTADLSSPKDPTGDRLYWDAASRLAAGDAKGAVGAAELGAGALAVSYEAEWRVAAVAAIAAKRVNATDKAAEFSARARQALQRLREAWKEHAGTYERRPDLVELLREAGLNSRS
jgi:eukaryotic-like serine/threonine-protein kinase